jgi:nucleotide-binding universal stress UspA family protein
MSNQNFARESSMGARDSSRMKRTTGTASEAFAEGSDAVQRAANTARQVAATTASTVSQQVKELLDDQVGRGANMVGHLANSAKRAAEDLDQNAPQLAGLVSGLADRLESYADDLRDQSVDQLVRAASGFTRRQPALVFGLAALAGFFALRTLKSTPSATPPSNQPTKGSSHRRGELYGA